jgi:hypothetical protein
MRNPKSRHAAALALVGWYLLVPPVQTDLGIVQIQADAPLSKWSIHSRYETPRECEKAREETEANGQTILQKSQGEQWGNWGNLLVLATCVATDDPRLAK